MDSNKFYFSYTYDLTHNLSDNFSYSLSQNKDIKETFESSDFPNFRWNDYIANHFKKACPGDIQTDTWVVRLILGCYEEMTIELFSNILSVHVVSRRMIQNAGTRYLRRGLNPEGFVANFVETEQIVHNQTVSSKIKPLFSSFIQVRGSVPLYWFQEPSLMNPKPDIKNLNEDVRMVGSNKHFSDMIGLYGRNIFCLNLMKNRLNKKTNKEEILSEDYRDLMRALKTLDKVFSSIEYLHIDLKNQIKEDQDNFFQMAFELADKLTTAHSFFMLSGFDDRCQPGEILVQYQQGISRVNCVDCLDRTNFMMNIIAELALNKQLKACLQMKTSDKLELSQKISLTYQSMWRNTGDNIALQYGGSKAHQQKDGSKVDVVFQSFKRFYTNTFKDNFKQYLISLFIGDFKPGSNELWDKKQVCTKYRPSSKILAMLQEGKLFGAKFPDFTRKITLKPAKKLDDYSYIIPVESLDKMKNPQIYKDLLFKSKLFENRKNLISELTEKRVIKGTDTRAEEDDDDWQLPEALRVRQTVVDARMSLQKDNEKSQELGQKVEELNSYYEPLVFSHFYKTAEMSRTKPVHYEELKKHMYEVCSNPAGQNSFKFDISGANIGQEKLIKTYDIFSVLKDEEESPEMDKPKKQGSMVVIEEPHKEKPQLETAAPISHLSAEMRMVLQSIPNSVRNKIKIF